MLTTDQRLARYARQIGRAVRDDSTGTRVRLVYGRDDVLTCEVSLWNARMWATPRQLRRMWHKYHQAQTPKRLASVDLPF